MILYTIDNKKGMIKQNGRFFIVMFTDEITIESRQTVHIDLDLYLAVDENTYILLEDNLHPLQLLTKSFYGSGKLVFTIYNPTDNNITLGNGNHLAQCIPLTTAYFSRIEMEQTRPEFFEATERIMIG